MSELVKKINSDTRLTRIPVEVGEIVRMNEATGPVLTTPATPTMGVTFVAGAAFSYNITRDG